MRSHSNDAFRSEDTGCHYFWKLFTSSSAYWWPLPTKGIFSHGEGLITTLAQCGLAISNLYLEIISPDFLMMFSFINANPR
uniref:SFRICE_022966 n=1 Tax=Spodoptera frugiperda TaxID=7108 RepID=A0A2H1X1F4_SPOFR